MSAAAKRSRVVPALVLALLVVAVLVVRLIPHSATYHAELANAGGLRAGDVVRVAGLDVGKVTGVSAHRDTVTVDFTLDDDVQLTDSSTTQVKLLSLLGQRYLALTVGDGSPLPHGDTIAKANSTDSFTIEEFALRGPDEVAKLDPTSLSNAVQALSASLRGSGPDLRAALDGMSRVSQIVADRDAQLDDLLASTQQVTSTVVAQQTQIENLIDDSDQVAAMLAQRRTVLSQLLHDARSLVVELTGLAQRNQAKLGPILRQAQTVLTTLRKQKKGFDEIFRLAGPTMRVYTNATGDGPWLGVNAPYFVFPDDFYCLSAPQECS